MNLVRRLRNPILGNELKLRMRTWRTPWATSLYLLVLGGLVLMFIFLQTGFDSYFHPDRAREIFLMLSLLQLAMVGFIVPGLTAGVISGERERQTLSILLTTNVSATKLILGKWLASLSFMIFLVLSSVPLYGIVLLYGGVSPVQLLEVFAFYLVTMLGLGSIGVLFSTLIKRTGIATVVTYGVIFCYTFGTGILAEVIRQFLRFRQKFAGITPGQQTYPLWLDAINSLNPVFTMLHIFGDGPIGRMGGSVQKLPIDPFWIYVLFFLLVSGIALSLAVYLLKPIRPRLGKH